MSESVKTKSGGNTLKIIIIILLVAILLGAAAFGGYFIASKNSGKEVIVKVQETPEELAYFETGEYVVNLADTEARRYLKAKIVLAYDAENKKLATEVESNLAAIRDGIISAVGEKKAEELTQKGREDLKKDILDRINPIFQNGKIINVFYSDILVQ